MTVKKQILPLALPILCHNRGSIDPSSRNEDRICLYFIDLLRSTEGDLSSWMSLIGMRRV
jgi:hypothetical protein